MAAVSVAEQYGWLCEPIGPDHANRSLLAANSVAYTCSEPWRLQTSLGWEARAAARSWVYPRPEPPGPSVLEALGYTEGLGFREGAEIGALLIAALIGISLLLGHLP
jgi:hypothetical protein